MSRWIALSRGAALGQLLFTAGWVVGGLVQGGAYSPARHDISDLGALGARHPWMMLVPQGLAGALTIAFALAALAPAMRRPGERGPLGAWLVALSLLGLDNLSDAFFRLDCRGGDAGCTAAAATASWHGTLHLHVAMVTGLVTVAAPFALGRRMRRLPEWADMAAGAFVLGAVLALAVSAHVALQGRDGGGYAQRASVLLASMGTLALARRVEALAR